jgi:large subunit ribosomal protein LX
MEVHNYIVRGSYKTGAIIQNFQKEIRAVREEDAIEEVYAEIGSKHRVKRNLIVLNAVEKIADADVTDPLVSHLIKTR